MSREKSSGCFWKVENLLVAGQRVSGETFASSPERAVVNVAARHARTKGVDVGAAVAGALKDNLRRVQPGTRYLAFHAVAHVADWGHRAELWVQAGLPHDWLNNAAECAYAPRLRQPQPVGASG